MNAVSINRDPFGRASLMRERVTDKCECAWCGQTAKFRYYWEGDSVQRRRYVDAKPFCSVGCWRDYNGGAR